MILTIIILFLQLCAIIGICSCLKKVETALHVIILGFVAGLNGIAFLIGLLEFDDDIYRVRQSPIVNSTQIQSWATSNKFIKVVSENKMFIYKKFEIR